MTGIPWLQRFREQLVAHNNAVNELLKTLTPEQRKALRAQYPRLDLYPLDFVREKVMLLVQDSAGNSNSTERTVTR